MPVSRDIEQEVIDLGKAIWKLQAQDARLAPANPYTEQGDVDPIGEPEAIQDFAVSNLGVGGVIRLSWRAPAQADVEQYHWEVYGTDTPTAGRKVLEGYTTELTVEVPELTPGEDYYARVQPINTNGDPGPWTPTVYAGVRTATTDAFGEAIDARNVVGEAFMEFVEDSVYVDSDGNPFTAYIDESYTKHVTGPAVTWPDDDTLLSLDVAIEADIISNLLATSDQSEMEVRLALRPYGKAVSGGVTKEYTEENEVDVVLFALPINEFVFLGDDIRSVLVWRFRPIEVPPQGPGTYEPIIGIRLYTTVGATAYVMLKVVHFNAIMHKR